MSKKREIRVGNKAIDFTVEDQKSKSFTLSDFKGTKVVLSFHPLAWTPVCSKQMKLLEENRKNFAQVNAITIGVSVDTVPSKKAWAKSLGITHIRLLSDFWPHGAVASQYNVFREKEGVSGRANIVISEEQTISYIKNYPLWKVPNVKEILRILNFYE